MDRINRRWLSRHRVPNDDGVDRDGAAPVAATVPPSHDDATDAGSEPEPAPAADRAAQLPIVLVGGSGRSGTSIFYGSLTNDRRFAAFHDFELKVTAEPDGLVDLYRGFVTDYSPSRAKRSLDRLADYVKRLGRGGLGQRPLSEWMDESRIESSLAWLSGRLIRDGVPQVRSEADLAGALRPWLTGLYASSNLVTDDTAAILEKTPHSLLQRELLRRMLGPVRFIHVVRDPRSVAQSLTRVSWGPGSLAQSKDWLLQYARRYVAIREERDDDDVLELRIEDVARDPGTAAARVSQHLGLDVDAGLFARVSADPLGAWATGLSRTDVAELSVGLEEVIQLFGYSESAIGTTSDEAS